MLMALSVVYSSADLVSTPEFEHNIIRMGYDLIHSIHFV